MKLMRVGLRERDRGRSWMTWLDGTLDLRLTSRKKLRNNLILEKIRRVVYVQSYLVSWTLFKSRV